MDSLANTVAARFHHAPRAAIRAVPWWDRLGYIQRRLPQAIAAEIRALSLGEGARVLDFGCADQPYRSALPASVEYVGADLPGNADAALQIQADGTLPVADAQFDAVLSTQVLEHVAEPATYLAECARVLKPGGCLLLSTHGIMLYHPDPVDYWRWTGAGLRRQIELSGLEVIELTGFMGMAATGLQLFQDSVYARLPRRLRRPWTTLMQSLIALFERRETATSRALNALVFIVTARRPALPDRNAPT